MADRERGRGITRDRQAKRILVRGAATALLLGCIAVATTNCSSSDSPEPEAASDARAVGRTVGGPESDGSLTPEAERPAAGIDREDIVVVDDDMVLPEPPPELTEEAIDLEEAIEERGVETPCDLYPTEDLRTQMTVWSESAGLTEDLPSGVLAPGSEIEFEVGVQSPTECSWFSEAQLWSVQISFEPVSGFTDALERLGEAIPGIGDAASITDDNSGSVRIGDLYVSVTNLPPGHTQTENDRTVLLSILDDVATKLA